MWDELWQWLRVPVIFGLAYSPAVIVAVYVSRSMRKEQHEHD